MDWVPLSGYEEDIDINDQPRFLSHDEIYGDEGILKTYVNNKDSPLYFPASPSADPEGAGAVSRQGVVDYLIDMLKVIKICPSAITELIALVIEQHYKSLVSPGTPIAITAGEAVGATTTQMTLNSVAPWEKLLIQDHLGVGHIVEIGAWIDELLLAADPTKIVHIPENRTQYLPLDNPVKIVTCDNDGKVTWEDVTAVTKHLPVGDLVKIKTRSGREVTATQQKSFLVWSNKDQKLITKNGLDIKVDDFVPIANQIPEPDVVHHELNLRKFLPPNEYMYISEMYALQAEHENDKIQNGKKSVAPRGWWDAIGRWDNVPYTRSCAFKSGYESVLKNNLENGCVYPKSWNNSVKQRIPEKILLDRKFGQIVGLYLADGCVLTDNHISISNNAPEVRQIVYDWCDSLGIGHTTQIRIENNETRKGTTTDVSVHSVLIAQLFKRWLKTGSSNKIMPQEILFGNKEFIIGVLDGYFSGDGSVCKDNGALDIGSTSEMLIDGFRFLCGRLGIFSKKAGHQQKSNNKGTENIKYMHTCTVRGFNADLWVELIGSFHNKKNDKMQIKYQRAMKWGNRYVKHENIMLDPIVAVEYIPSIPYVYDLTVPSTLNFSLYNSLCVIDTFHSSGSSKSASFGIDAMRDIIFARKTPKNESCTIYYNKQSITYEEVLNSRRYIVGSVISDFVVDFDIDSPENIKGGQKWWNSADGLFDDPLPAASRVLRLFLNTIEMYKQKVTIKQLADILEREAPPSVITRYGPMSDGIIDVYPSSEIKKTINKKLYKKDDDIALTDDLSESTYLETIVRPELKNIRVKGIKGIKYLYPRIIPVWSIVLLERKFTEEDMINDDLMNLNPNNDWILFFNPDIMHIHGLKAENVAKLCELAGIEVIGGIQNEEREGENFNRIYISMPNDKFRTSNGEVVIDINDVKYRDVNFTDLYAYNGSIYEKLDEKNIKNLPDNVNDYYRIEIEKEDKKSVSATRWIEEEVPAVIINIPSTEIILVENDYYRRINNTYDENLQRTTEIIIIEDVLYQRTDLGDNERIEYEGLFYRKLDKLYQDLTGSNLRIKELKPGEYVTSKISDAKKEYKDRVTKRTNEFIEREKELKIKRPPINISRPDIMKAAELVIADTEGPPEPLPQNGFNKAYKELLALHSVDKRRTTCNNMHVIADVIGIEATRTFIIRQLYNTISNTGSYVHPANIMFIAEFITSKGAPFGTTFTGISRQPGGHLSLATVERAGQTFTKHALHGRKEDIRNVSASISVGARMHIGNGMFDIAQNIVENGEEITLVNDDVFTAHKRDDEAKKRIRDKASEVEEYNVEDELAAMAAIGDIGIGDDDFTEGIEDVSNQFKIGPIDFEDPDDLGDIIIGQVSSGSSNVTEEILSEGLVISTDIRPSVTGAGLPVTLSTLLDRYRDQFSEFPEYYSRARLPTSSIPILSSTGINLRRDQQLLQSEVTKNLIYTEK